MISEVQTLLQEGTAALLAGDSFEARQRFRRVLEIEPDNVEALLGVAGTVRPYQEKRDYLRRALDLDPANTEVRATLEYVESKIAAGEVLAPRGVTISNPPASLLTPPTTPEPETAPAVDVEYCYIHPSRETGLHCTNCNRPICYECVRAAPVGQLCPECARARRPRNYQVTAGTLVLVIPVALVAGLVVTFLASLLLGMSGFFGFLIAFLLGPVSGEAFVRLLDRLTKAKRGKEMQIAVGVSLGLGAAPWLLLPLLFGLIPSLSLILFMGLSIATAVARLR